MDASRNPSCPSRQRINDKEIEQLYKEEKAAQKSAQEQADYTAELEEISSRRQTIDVLLSCGNLMPDEEERLSELRKEITAKGAVLDQLSQKSSKAFCPFCLGRTKNPHLYLNTEKNRFFCQRCGEHGNSVSLYAKMSRICTAHAGQGETRSELATDACRAPMISMVFPGFYRSENGDWRLSGNSGLLFLSRIVLPKGISRTAAPCGDW